MKVLLSVLNSIRIAFVFLFLLFSISNAEAGQSRSHFRSHTSSIGQHRSTYSRTAPRASNGKIKRSSKEKHEFMKESGYPKGRPGYVVDHVVPLSNGGADSPSNMQWQTKADAKAKDKWERGQKSSPKKYKSKRR